MKTEVEIEALVRSFEDCSLTRASWTHASHLIVALWYLAHYPPEEATERIRQGIRRYNASQGNLIGYHETITLAWAAVIGRFLDEQGPGRPIAELAVELLDACSGKDYLSRYYSSGQLQSEAARHRWIPPDREPIVWHARSRS